MILLLTVVFVFSGAAGLMYESIWTRYLGLFVGHSAYAQIIVLVIFLGGMSIGALLVGRRSKNLQEPLLWYAIVEIITGLIGLVFHDVFTTVTGIAYGSIFPAIPGGALLTVVKWLIAALLILPQSILLGATFPLMTAGALRRRVAEPGWMLAQLYFANSFGAAIGVLVAGFYLVNISGLPGTLIAAAVINILVGLVVFFAIRLMHEDEDEAALPAVIEPERAVVSVPQAAPIANLRRVLLAVSAGTAIASFIYEIAWIRMLSLVLGSATHSFELMLSAFILGLALGSLWIRKHADSFADPLRTLGIVQLLMGMFAIATLPFYLASFGWTESLLDALQRSEQGYFLYSMSRYGMSLAVMLPATFCAGMTLPIITRMLIATGAGEKAIGDVYGINTLGSIVGVALAGLVLMPVLGVKGLLIAGAAVDMALGIYLLWRRPDPVSTQFKRRDMAIVAAAVVIAVASFSRFDQLTLSSGVYRNGRLLDEKFYQMIFYQDGRTATVSARRQKDRGHLSIATNGKPDASLRTVWLQPPPEERGSEVLVEDEPTQLLLAMITLAHAPRAETGAVIGQGSGMSSHFLLGSPHLKELRTIEIEPAMIAGSKRAFYPANKRVFDDPRSHFVVDDAKSYFASAHRKFDIIMSEPSNPWVSGVSGLFTSEFYHRVSGYLSDNGVFGQWLHLYEINDKLVLSVLAALHENFASYEIFLVANSDILIVASNKPSVPKPDWTVFQYPDIDRDMRRILPFTGATLEHMRLANSSTLAPLFELSRHPNSDYYPLLDLGTERTRFLHSDANGFINLNTGRFDLISSALHRRVDFDSSRVTPVPAIPRLQALAVGARLRSVLRGSADTLRGDSDFDAALFNQSMIEGLMASGRSPSDWGLWARAVLNVERVLHGGTAGVVDEEFYRPIYAYMNKVSAPPDVVDAIDFMHALAAWDYPTLAAKGDRVIEHTLRVKRALMAAEILRDATVIAKLATNDVKGARRVFEVMASSVKRDPEDVRSTLLEAYLIAAENAAKARGPASKR